MNDKQLCDVLGTMITEYREKCCSKISSREFAEKCGVSKTVINSIENHKHNGNICTTTLNKIAIGLGLDDYFQLREAIIGYSRENKIILKEPESIVLNSGTKLYDLFDTIKNFDDESIEMLHSLALKFKK